MKSVHYQRILLWNRQYMLPYLLLTVQFIQAILSTIFSTIRQLTRYEITCVISYVFLFLISMKAIHVYWIDMPKWEYEHEWISWEMEMQRSVANLIPPLPSDSSLYDGVLPIIRNNEEWKQQVHHHEDDNSSKFVVPLPDYELISNVRGELAERLRDYAMKSCEEHKLLSTTQQQQQKQAVHSLRSNSQSHLLPVMGITVATDSPNNNYLRRLLYTIDFDAVGSTVITWYDEQTESQLSGREGDRLSHKVILSALEEFIVTQKFVEIPWDRHSNNHDDIDNSDHAQRKRQKIQLADVSSMQLMSKIATSVHQYCRYENEINTGTNQTRGEHTTYNNNNLSSCQNELIILRFSTNLGCSTGVNNPLFLHPTAPHWLIVNYDIAYPPGVLNAMGHELHMTKLQKPDLAVHTFGYIYGRGKIENPWSNFVMTSCAVANVGIWDENIFPAYYEDDDFRDRIRYIMGKWVDVIESDAINNKNGYRNVPYKWMNDTHLIRYQTDRNVAVAHGPLTANTYLSGTHEALKEEAVEDESLFRHVLNWLLKTEAKQLPQVDDPYHYESERWNIYKEVADNENYFRCKHGALPDPGEHGEDSLRYFGWHERFIEPFANRTRLTKLKERMAGKELLLSDNEEDPSHMMWSRWSLNATRRKCVHEATNTLLTMPPSEEKVLAMLRMKESCSVCSPPPPSDATMRELRHRFHHP